MEFLVIAVLAAIVRLVPVLRNQRIDFDTYGHLYYASAIREQKIFPWDSIKIQCWAGEKFSHPFFVHWLIARFQKDAVLKYQKLINPFLDALFCTFVYQGSLIYFGGDKKLGLLCALLYLFTPMWFSKISMGPRVHNFTPRLITEIAFPVLLFIASNKPESGNTIQTIICQVMLIILILNSTKFGVQVILFMVPLISLISLTTELISSTILALIITIVISRGKYYSQISRQVAHLIEYYKLNNKNKTLTANRNRFEKINLKRITYKDEIRRLIYCYVYNNSYTAVVIKMPIIALALINTISMVSSPNGSITIENAAILSAIVIYLLINQRKFLFLGEAERYLNHISLVIIFEAVAHSQQNNNLLPIYVIITYGILFWIIENSFFSQITNTDKRDSADDEIERILKDIKDKRIICTYSYHNFCVYRIMLNTHHEAVFPYHMERNISDEFIAKYQSNYPYVNMGKIKEVCSQTNSNILIIDNYSTSEAELMGLKLEEDGWNQKQLNNDTYKLYIK